MKTALLRILEVLAVLAAAGAPAYAWPQSGAALTPPQLEQLVAPIALYPDPLLGEVLMAATYPLEVTEAAQWARAPENAGLTGDDLAAALQPQGWDPSVKSLVPFPKLLDMMASHLGWTQQLGDAFLAQPAAVMDAVQRLRARARNAGTLYSTPQAVVSSDGVTTSIEPADPQLLYLPVYDPGVVYGPWPYPDYPPYYFLLYPGYGVVGGIGFGTRIWIVTTLWGWADCDWRRHHIRIDHDRFNAINRSAILHGQAAATTMGAWQHDPFHRHGVAYRDEHVRAQFVTHPSGAPETRRGYRGFTPTSSLGIPPPAPVRVAPVGNLVAPVSIPTPAVNIPTPPVAFPTPSMKVPPAPQILPAATPAPVTVQSPQSRPAAAFHEIERGREVHTEAERGRASRESAVVPGASAGSPAPSAPAPRGGEGRFGRHDR